MRGQLPIGSVVAGYRIIELVGEGASGAVYLAEHEEKGERVALKVLADDLAHDDRFRQRFLRESTIAAGARHPHVVGILDFGEADGAVYLAMRYIEGADLRELLGDDGPLDPEGALRLVAQVGEALDEAHARGLVHRDVKPANILVDRDGAAYLGDFGLAKHASSPSSLTGEQSFVGTIAYIAPEQIKGEQVDGRADVYALTCVLYEALTGRTPFERESELAVLFAHLHEQAPRASDVRPGLAPGLDHVLRTGTAKEPKDRYASCAELMAAARGALAGERGPRTPVRARTVALAGVVLAAAVAGLIVAIGGGEEPAAPVHRLAVGGDGFALVNARTHTIAARVRLPGVPSDVVFDKHSGWALLGDQQKVAQVDLRRRAVVRTVKLPFPAGGIAIGDAGVFVTERAAHPALRDQHPDGEGHRPLDHRDARCALLGSQRDRRGRRLRVARARRRGRPRRRRHRPGPAPLPTDHHRNAAPVRRRRPLGGEQRERDRGEDRPRRQPDRRDARGCTAGSRR